MVVQEQEKKERYTNITHCFCMFFRILFLSFKNITSDLQNVNNINFVVTKNIKDLLLYRVKYQIDKPMIATAEIDFSKELLGVVEYLSQGKRKIVMKGGDIRTEEIPILPKTKKKRRLSTQHFSSCQTLAHLQA